MLSILRLTCLLVLCFVVGCVEHTPWQTLNQADAPWTGPQTRGKLQDRLKASHIPFLPIPPAVRREYRYIDPAEVEVFDTVDVGQRVEAFLRDRGQFEVQLKPSHRDGRHFVEAFDRWQEGKEPQIVIPLVTPFRMTLVSLDPLVILLTAEMSLYNEGSNLILLPPDESFNLPTGDAGVVKREGLRDGLPVLPGGVIPATRLAMTKQIQWFSPTLEKGPTPLHFDADGVAEILVPWGRLLIRQQGKTLEVSTEP